MDNSTLRFKLTIDADSKALTFEDTTTYTTLEELSSGLLLITDENDAIVYENSGYDTDDYSAPDVINPVSSISEAFPMLLGEDGEIINGNYNVSYKLRIFTNTTTTVSNVEVLATDLKVINIGTVTSTVAAQLVETGYLVIESGSNIGNYKIVESTYNGTDVTITTDVDLTAEASTDIDFGLPTSYLDYVSDKDFKYCYTAPEVSISHIIRCDNQTLQSSDATDYRASIIGTWFTPISAVRTHSVSPPLGSGYPTIDDSTDKVRLFSDIWTKTWQTAISTVTTYNVEDWDDVAWLIYTDTLTGQKTAEVTCGECTCKIRECINNLYNDWREALSVNAVLAQRLQADVLAVNAEFTMYLQAERCGSDVTPYCENISEILTRNNCNCAPSEDKGSEPVSSDESDISGGGRARIIMGVDFPNYDIGSDDDMYIWTTTQNYYWKVDSQWIYQGNIMGVDGLGWYNGIYNDATGKVSFQSNDGLGFTTGDIRGEKGDAGTGLNNRGNWAAGSYEEGDYVFSAGSVNSSSMWIINATSYPYASTVAPASDVSNWVEFEAPAGPEGPTDISDNTPNAATLGTDSLILVNKAGVDSLGVDADTLDGIEGSEFVRNTGTKTIAGNTEFTDDVDLGTNDLNAGSVTQTTLHTITDGDSISTTVINKVGSSWTGSPYAGVNGSNQGYLMTKTFDGNYAMQEFMDLNNIFNKLQRRKNNGVWSSWNIFYTSYNFGKTQIDALGLNYNGLDNLPNLSLKADLVGGLIPSSQLPAYVDDVLDTFVVGSIPLASDWLSLTSGGTALTPEGGKIYLVTSTGTYENKQYRWSGTQYAEISSSLTLGEGVDNAYYGNLGKIAYDHSQLAAGNPHDVKATQITDFDTEVSDNSSVAANTSKISYTDAAAVSANTIHRNTDGNPHDTDFVDLNNIPQGILHNHFLATRLTNCSDTGYQTSAMTSDCDQPVPDREILELSSSSSVTRESGGVTFSLSSNIIDVSDNTIVSFQYDIDCKIEADCFVYLYSEGDKVVIDSTVSQVSGDFEIKNVTKRVEVLPLDKGTYTLRATPVKGSVAQITQFATNVSIKTI